MVLSRQPVSPRLLFALGLACCALPGCGSSGSSPVSAVTVARSLTQTFQGQALPSSTYMLDAPIDQTQPLVVTVSGTSLIQGKDYSIDPSFPNVIRVNNPLSASTTVMVQYTPLPFNAQRFSVTAANQTTFTLTQAVDTTYLNLIRVVLDSPGSGPKVVLTSSEYTLTAGPPTVIRLVQPITSPRTLTVTYVPKTH